MLKLVLFEELLTDKNIRQLHPLDYKTKQKHTQKHVLAA